MGFAITSFLILLFTAFYIAVVLASTDKFDTAVSLSIAWILSFFISVPPLYIFGAHFDTGSGQYTGYVTGVEKTGMFFKTGTAYMKTDLTSSNEDAFCVIDDSVYTQLQDFSASKSPVTIQYSSYLAAGIADCAGEDAFITSVNLK